MSKHTLSGLNKGTYILILYLMDDKIIQVGALGEFNFPFGYWAYVGSAFGPGGLASRLKHHLRPTDKPHWHIDYLRRQALLKEVWITEQRDPREHIWATALHHLNGATTPVHGFGCSDCTCHTHLFHFYRPPPIQGFQKGEDQVFKLDKKGEGQKGEGQVFKLDINSLCQV